MLVCGEQPCIILPDFEDRQGFLVHRVHFPSVNFSDGLPSSRPLYASIHLPQQIPHQLGSNSMAAISMSNLS